MRFGAAAAKTSAPQGLAKEPPPPRVRVRSATDVELRTNHASMRPSPRSGLQAGRWTVCLRATGAGEGGEILTRGFVTWPRSWRRSRQADQLECQPVDIKLLVIEHNLRLRCLIHGGHSTMLSWLEQASAAHAESEKRISIGYSLARSVEERRESRVRVESARESVPIRQSYSHSRAEGAPSPFVRGAGYRLANGKPIFGLRAIRDA